MMSAIPSDLCCFFAFESLLCYPGGRQREESHKIDDLPVLVTCQSGTLVMLSAKLTVLLLMEALDDD